MKVSQMDLSQVFNIICKIMFILIMINMVIKKDKNKLIKIDSSKVQNVCLHYDGKFYYYTALVNGKLNLIEHSKRVKKCFDYSKIEISDLSVIWETDIPKDKTLLKIEDLPTLENKKNNTSKKFF